MFHNKFGILSARCLFRGITVNMDIKGVELSGNRLQGCTDQVIGDIGKCQVLKLHDARTGRQDLSAESSPFPYKEFF